MTRKQIMSVIGLGGLLITASVGLMACGGVRTGDRSCVGGDCDVQSTACSRDTDCSTDQYCDAGLCAPRSNVRPDDACTAHQDCSAGLFCNIVTGHCVECLNEDHCEVGLVCRADGTCGDSTGCTANSECGGRVCDTSSGQCVQCLTSANCPSGQTCRDKQCFTDGGTDPVCNSQADCDAYGRICDGTGHCVMCSDSSQCADGKTCNNGSCTNGNTSGDGTCQSRDECSGQGCVAGYCMPCFVDIMCNATLNDLMSGVNKICEIETGNCIDVECQTADNCPAGEACYGSGHCGSCQEDAECRSSEVCNVDTGICGAPPACTGNASCTGGKVCLNSVCSACTGSTQCDAGKECVGGVCLTPEPECTTAADCSNGTVCVGGACAPCTTASQCGSGKLCTDGACVNDTSPGAFGATCSSHADCRGNDGFCMRWGSTGHCSRTCVGNGKGGLEDCPLGWACNDFNDGALDGAKLCAKASDIGSGVTGYPFEQAPGDTCDYQYDNQCQTGVCFSDTDTCAAACLANRDCPNGELCYNFMDSNGVSLNQQLCGESNLTNYKAEGVACNNAIECDSGLCVGKCSNGSDCNKNSECPSGTCNGTCRDHCRANSDCKEGQACWPWALKPGTDPSVWVPTCQPKRFSGTKELGAACTTYSECASDWCVFGICTSPCATNDDCTGPLAGKVCGVVAFNGTDGSTLYAQAVCR